MSAEPLRLDDVLESVADGAIVDWDALEVAANPQQQRMLKHLRVVAGVAEVHRTMPVDDTTLATAASPSPLRIADSAVSQWGHLRLLKKVGEGAFGEVYSARDAWLDREVALKLLKPGVASDVPVTRLIAEARTLARVRHPNVVTVHGADMHEGRVGLWMDFVRGATLAQIVAERGAFSAAEATVIGQEVVPRARGRSRRRPLAPRHQSTERDARIRRARRPDGLRRRSHASLPRTGTARRSRSERPQRHLCARRIALLPCHGELSREGHIDRRPAAGARAR